MKYTHDQLLDIQKNLELHGKYDGAARFHERHKRAVEGGRAADTAIGQAVISKRISALTEAVAAFFEGYKGKRKPEHVKRLEAVSADVIASVTLGEMFTAIHSTPGVNALANRIGNALAYEAHKQALSAKAQKDLEKALKKGLAGYEAVKKFKDAALEDGKPFEPWDKTLAGNAGEAFIFIACEATGLFEVSEGPTNGTKKGKKVDAPRVLVATETLTELMENEIEFRQFATPIYKPMVVRPKRWNAKNVFNGCYLTREQAPVPLMKRRVTEALEAVRDANPEQVFEALNLIQETPLRIRRKILKFLQECVKRGVDFGLKPGSIPQLTELPLDLPVNEWVDDPELIAKYKKLPEEKQDYYLKDGKALKVDRDGIALLKERIQANEEAQNLRFNFMSTLEVADQFKEFQHIYIPHNLDDRGRVYALLTLSLQGADYCKGLLEFSEGKRIGVEGIKWLYIHTANLFGVDKVSFEDRVKWTVEHMDDLLASAADPFTNTFWTTADKPIQALSVCYELQGVKKRGAKHYSRMPIALDGSCSGLQHLGAAFRCSKTGQAVNLMDSDKPNDIYGDVAKIVDVELKANAEQGDEMAKQWLEFLGGTVTRSHVKRNTMTYSYGSAASGMADQAFEDIVKPAYRKDRKSVPWGYVEVADDKGEKKFKDERRVACRYFGEIAYNAICATVKKAAEAMVWLQDSAKAIAGFNRPVWWTTPLGLPILQARYKTKSAHTKIIMNGQLIKGIVSTDTKDIDPARMVNAIAPNVVHSLDSTHLMMVALRAAEEGIRNFAMIHDSFGTHAADTGRFFHIIRETFKELYEKPVFESLQAEFEAQLADAKANAPKPKGRPKKNAKPKPEVMIGDLPIKGDYDLDLILRSTYSFA